MKALWKKRKRIDSISSLYEDKLNQSTKSPAGGHGQGPGLGSDWGAGFGGFRHKKKWPYWKKLTVQLAVCLIIALIAIGVTDSNNFMARKVDSAIRYLMTKKVDYRPVFQKVVDLSLRYKNLDWPLLDDTPASPPSVTVSSQSGNLTPLPLSGKISRSYGWVKSDIDSTPRFHEGIDIEAGEGAEVSVVMAGKVEKIGEDKMLGKYVIIDHGNKMKTMYGSLANVKLKAGQTVKEGQTVGSVGESEEGDNAHLHFEVRENNKLIDPMDRIKADSGK